MKHAVVIVALAFSVCSAISQTVAPNENLVLDGIPPIPSSIADGIGRYTEFRSAALLSWHPVYHDMLISTRFGDVPQIHLVKMPGGARTQLTFYPERILGGSYNPVHGKYFVFSKDIGGGEWYQNFRYDVASGDVTLLTDGKSRNSLGVWSHDGKLMAYTSTRRNNKDTDIYTVDPMDTSTNKLALQVDGGGWGADDWTHDGKTLLVREYVSANESYLYLLTLATGEKRILTPKGGKEQISYGGGQFTPDGKGFYVTTDRESEFQRLTYIDLATMKHEYLTTGIPWDVSEFNLSNDGKRIAFVTNEDGVSVLHVLNAATRKEEKVPQLPVGLISGVQWHNDGTLLGFVMNSARSTSDVYSIDMSTGKIDRWTTSETGGINVDNFSEARLIKWKTFDGKTISGFLYPPPAKFTGKRPVIVNIHGGPEGQSFPGFLGRSNYYLNEMGVAIIYPNIRGSSGYGKTFLKLDNGMNREDSYKDLGALLDWIKTQPDLDGDRILVTGGSYGGHSTLVVSTFYSDKIKCSVDVVGMSNLVTFLERTESYRRDLRRAEYGDEREPKMREYLENIAPMNNVGKIKKPMFVVQGKNDPRVPFTEADQIVGALKNSGTPVWYLMAKDEGHGFSKKKNQDFQFYATVMFLKEYLLK
ncbi:MAG TPA: prolyl oligopeptidase family serine peptidase [Bacteroidota bacterium]|nr:prolyl oligopeptidase family serine peptidase [Bacteroidota bacterium]